MVVVLFAFDNSIICCLSVVDRKIVLVAYHFVVSTVCRFGGRVDRSGRKQFFTHSFDGANEIVVSNDKTQLWYTCELNFAFFVYRLSSGRCLDETRSR